MPRLFISLALLLASATAVAADRPVKASRAPKVPDDEELKPAAPPKRFSATSTFTFTPYTQGDRDMTEVSRRFHAEELDANRLVLFQEEVETHDSPAAGGRQGTVRLTAEELMRDGKRTPIFKLIERGQEGQFVQGDQYLITNHGCCDTVTGSVLYSARTGKRLLYAKGSVFGQQLIPFSLPHVPEDRRDRRRWIAVYTPRTPFDRAVFADHHDDRFSVHHQDDSRAVVTYASPTEPRTRVRLNFSPFGWVSVERVDVDATQVVRIHFGDRGVVEIPVRDDALDVAHAKLPTGVTTQLLSPEWPALSADKN